MKKGKQERAGKLPDEREVKDEAVGTAIGERRRGGVVRRGGGGRGEGEGEGGGGGESPKGRDNNIRLSARYC